MNRHEKYMKHFAIALLSIFLCAGCVSGFGGQEVTFEYFNLSTNEIWVTDIAGLPAWASPGRLMPSHAEDALEVTASTSFETVRIKDQIKIIWKDNGQQGWPGGLKPGELVPAGITHEAQFKRDDLGIPAKLKNGKIRFTYLGNDKWRVKLLSADK